MTDPGPAPSSNTPGPWRAARDSAWCPEIPGQPGRLRQACCSASSRGVMVRTYPKSPRRKCRPVSGQDEDAQPIPHETG